MSAHWVCSPIDYRAHRLVPDLPPGVLRACCGALLPPVAVRFSDRSCGSLVCPACAERTAGSGPSAGWPLDEVPPPRCPPPARHSAGIPAPVCGDRPGPCREPEAAALRWGSCPAEWQLHLLDPATIGEVGLGEGALRSPDLRHEPHPARRVGGEVRELRECGERPLSTPPQKLEFSSGAPVVARCSPAPSAEPRACCAPRSGDPVPFFVRDEVNHD